MTAYQAKIPLSDIKVFFFDLDNTLYPHDCGLWEVLRDRINLFMIDQMQLPAEQVPDLRHRLWSQYGTTLRGLQAEYQVDTNAYLEYVHSLPLRDFIKPNPALPQLLAALPQPKVIFTNSDADHARRVLAALKITDHFQDIIDVHIQAPHCKPQPEAFQKALARVNERPENCLLIDDSPDNLEAAQQLGFKTVSIGPHFHAGSPYIPTIEKLLDVIS
ncbi:MAG: pyrimidine 5'-nucleotidase [Chloroflexota bacterium]|nr:pyrimidine 5'-nucleotidase [Chloroflexota bacterium]